MTIYVCPKCGGQQQAITGATLWHPCPRNGGKQVRLEVTTPITNPGGEPND